MSLTLWCPGHPLLDHSYVSSRDTVQAEATLDFAFRFPNVEDSGADDPSAESVSGCVGVF